jgi:hypothetical protein
MHGVMGFSHVVSSQQSLLYDHMHLSKYIGLYTKILITMYLNYILITLTSKNCLRHTVLASGMIQM